MRHYRLAALLFVMLSAVSGCQTLYSYRPLTVVARDAETKQPIAGAEVHVSYPLLHASQAPFESTADTGADGVARLRAAPSGPAGVLVEVKAKGYLYEQHTLGLDTVQNLKPTGLFEDVARRPADLTLELYAEPRPVVELKLPAGFRGLIKAEVKVQPGAAPKRGERVFRYAVTPTGDVLVAGPPLVERVQPLDYRAIAHDGTPLRCDATGLDIGFYALKSDTQFLTFFVGTRVEFETLRRAALRDDVAPTRSRPSGGGGGGGGGRHGGRSNSSSSDRVLGGL